MKLEHEVNFRWLILFALPTIFSSIFANLYTTVDGIFVAQWVNTDALSAINITLPMTYLSSALGIMFGTGGNALVAKKIGEGRAQEAREDFSLLMAVAFVFGMVFQLSFITVGRAGLGALPSVIGGVLNIVLDWLFMAVFHWGLTGAAIATSIGYAFPSVVGTIWFCTNRKQVLYVVRPKWRLRTVLQSCGNGSSEMVSVLAFSVVTILFNRILMELGSSDGVASLTIIWYAQGLFGGLFRGYINGIASVVSYNLGRGDKARLSCLFRISVRTLGITAAVVTAASYLFGGAVVGIFAKGNAHVATIALHGFRIAAVSFLMMAYNIFASGWFTDLNDGKTSAILSFCRTMVFMVIPVLVLPRFFEMDGVWMALAAGEILSIAMSIYYFIKYRAMWQAPKATAAN